MNRILPIFFVVIVFLSFVNFVDAQKKSRKKSSQSKVSKEKDAYKEKLLADLEKQLKEDRPTKVFVFVGEKIEVVEFKPQLKPDEIPFDYSFNAKYKVIQNVFGDYDKDIIEFKVFDHYGIPPFSHYKNVLLFVSEYNGKLYHEKYQYFDVYQTKDGRWARCGDPYIFEEVHRKKFKSEKLEFSEPLIFDITKYNKEFASKYFKPPYFRVNSRKAECLMGTYVNDLFKVKRDGVLKAREIF